MAYSEETQQMLRLGRGYNCESYGELSGVQQYKKVLEHEVEDMYNVHIVEETATALGIEGCRGLKAEEGHWENVRICTEKVEKEIDKRFGSNSKSIWLGTNVGVRARYCAPGERPTRYIIPENSLVMSDLGSDGALFLFPEYETELIVTAEALLGDVGGTQVWLPRDEQEADKLVYNLIRQPQRWANVKRSTRVIGSRSLPPEKMPKGA
jgi:hypothetical protein